MHDSVTLWKRGDTVYKEKYQIVYKDRWYDRHHTDTVIRRDSIRVPYPVERSLTRWERWRMKLGGYAGIAIVIVVMGVVGRYVVKRQMVYIFKREDLQKGDSHQRARHKKNPCKHGVYTDSLIYLYGILLDLLENDFN